MAPVRLWLRGETKVDEHRTAMTPSVVKALVAQGFEITVERCPERFFQDSEFEAAGAKLVEKGTWRTAPSDYFIVGLKELPENDTSPLTHRHIFFGHCFKGQYGWKELLQRFTTGGGALLDMEFLNDEKVRCRTGRRVAAFGYYAGYAGAAVGLDVWAHQQLGALKMEPSEYPSIQPFRDEPILIAHVKQRLDAARGDRPYPKVHVIGALGRCGSGAVAFCRAVGLPEDRIVQWDMAETKPGGPFPQIMESDVFINCIYLSQPIPPFLDNATLAKGGPLSVLVDVSCDITNPHNPLPVYSSATTFRHPVLRVPKSDKPNDTLAVVAIDHLPTLLPREASDRFANDLLPSFQELAQYETARVWQEALALFNKKVAEAHAA